VEIQGASVQVRNGDVNSALRKLKKILEGDDRQKDLAKHEFYEKPSAKNKRSRDAAKKRTKRAQYDNVLSGNISKPVGTKWQKSKRKRRKVLDAENAFTIARRKSGR
jgi:ribosomal protein S21